MVDLLAEMRAIGLPWAGARALLEAGVPRATVAALNMAGDLAIANVDVNRPKPEKGLPDGTDLFEFGGPDRRLIVGVRNAAGELVDLVALAGGLKQRSDRPDRDPCEDEWALRLGAADFLGEDHLWHAHAHAPSNAGREPSGSLGSAAGTATRVRACGPAARSGGRRWELRLYATPMAWLRAGGAGICVLDWTASALGALRGVGSGVTLVVEPGAKARLDAMLAHGGLPLVAETQTVRRAA